MQISTKKMTSLISAAWFFAENKEATIEDLAAYLKKDYTTALRIVKTLLEKQLIKLGIEYAATRKGKGKRYYTVTLFGIELYLYSAPSEKIREMAKTHSDKLLVFKKWDKFVQNDSEDAIITLAKMAVADLIRARFFFDPLITGGKLILPKGDTPEAFDMNILGFPYFAVPLDHVREEMKDEWICFQKVLKVVSKDYELRRLRDDFLYYLQRECDEKTKTLAEWRTYIAENNLAEQKKAD